MDKHDKKNLRAESPVDTALDHDLKSLSKRSRQNPRSLDHVMQSIQVESKMSAREDSGMLSWLKAKPKVAGFTVLAVIAAALLFIPISYDKVVGHEVALSIQGDLERDALSAIANQFKDALDVEGVGIDVAADNGKMTYTLQASVPAEMGKQANKIASAFASNLSERGLVSSANVEARKERVSGNLYAAAMNNVISVDIDGKSEAEVEAEILAGLEAAGISNAQVDVTIGGDGVNERTIDAEIMVESDDPNVEAPVIQITDGGEAFGGETEIETSEQSVKIMTEETNGASAMIIEIAEGGDVKRVKVDLPADLSDAQLADHVASALRKQGVNMGVEVKNGRVKLTDDAAPSRTEGTTWGKLKKDLGNN
ncbi:MAG: hypothetical protein HKN21_14585 [Candidatus Eisenbacteria bacterium]|uniref:Uncharacterized protein n=1 Tax=Eiseniibacteriota bacterium TaxID=2212470 RepID=A0A7Y2H3M7_UNCEI|nr:hypothetical protein [Candidatus Eisenbacteria bacterium]